MNECIRNAPVLLIPQDILWNIFLLNSDMKEDDLELPRGGSKALTTTRFCSQVCRSWRLLILNSASIWGNLIDLDNINGSNIQWGREILRRAGHSTLCVQGFFRHKPTAAEQNRMHLFLPEFLSTKWNRIRSLRIALGGWNYYAEPFLNALVRPADSLETFEFTAPHDLTLEGELFGGYAPRLREYSCPVISLTWKEPWVRQLKKIQLPVDIDATQALGILKHMPFLEEINFPELRLSVPPHDLISLPRLLQLYTFSLFDATLAILESIDAGPCCGLDLTIRCNGGESYTEDQLLAAQNVLSRYSTSYFSSKWVNYLELHLNDRWLFISDATIQSQDRRFAISLLALRKQPLPSSVQSLFIGLFTTSRLSTVTEFFFSYKMTRTQEEMESNTVKVIAQLSSVRRLKVASDSSLSFLDAMEDYGVTALPSLRELVVIDVKTFNENWEERLHHFLNKRRKRGAGIANLLIHLPSSPSPEQLRSLLFLEEMTGMTLAFQTADAYVECVCGSGKSLNLIFS